MADLLSTKNEYRVNASSNTIQTKPTTYLAVVETVYLSLEKDDTGNNIIPGSIAVKGLGVNNKGIAKTVYPIDEMCLTVPIVGEIVEVFNDSNVPSYRRFNFNESIGDSVMKGRQGLAKSPLTDIGSFKSLALSGGSGGFGSLLGGNAPAKRLRLYEGDTVIQSRYGQSIRMSRGAGGGNPILIIRNGEAKKGLLGGLLGGILGGNQVDEDVNKDGSTIAISAGTYLSPFSPGTPLPVVGTSNFKMNPSKALPAPVLLNNKSYAFESYPKTLDGNQIIITSDRLVFSSRINEMIFWSKGNYGVITDGVFSVDTFLGANINSKGNIDIQAPENNINLYVGKAGKINLGDNDMQPVVKGIALKNILLEIITEMENLKAGGLLTPAGPVSGMNPAMSSKLREIKSNLNSILSTKVDVSS
jgi:hypothetical protein